MIYIYDPSVWPAEAADAAARGKYQLLDHHHTAAYSIILHLSSSFY